MELTAKVIFLEISVKVQLFNPVITAICVCERSNICSIICCTLCQCGCFQINKKALDQAKVKKELEVVITALWHCSFPTNL